MNMCDVRVSHHGIILQFVHEVSSLGSLVVVEPHAALELVPGVQQQHVALGGADPLDHRGSAGHSGETPAAPPAAAAFPGVLAGLLHPGVHVVGVEEDQVPGRWCGHWEAQQEEEAEAEPRQSAPLRAQRSHLSAARKNHWRGKPGCSLTWPTGDASLSSFCLLHCGVWMKWDKLHRLSTDRERESLRGKEEEDYCDPPFSSLVSPPTFGLFCTEASTSQGKLKLFQWRQFNVLLCLTKDIKIPPDKV